jgi:hypothetical protein
MFITTWSQKLLCNCKGHQDITCIMVLQLSQNDNLFNFLKYILLLLYLNDLKFTIQKYHLFL